MGNCEKCGAQNPEDALFCSNCGYNPRQEDVPPEWVTPPPGVAPTTQPPSEYQYQAPPPAYPPQASPPAYPAQAPPPGYPPQAPPVGYQYRQQGYYPPMVVSNNGKAIASLVLGIVGIVACPIVFSIIGLILGYQARNEIAASMGWQTGESLAKAGIILGWVGLILYIAILFFYAIIFAIAGSSNLIIIPF
jgi:hypothetical protein